MELLDVPVGGLLGPVVGAAAGGRVVLAGGPGGPGTVSSRSVLAAGLSQPGASQVPGQPLALLRLTVVARAPGDWGEREVQRRINSAS